MNAEDIPWQLHVLDHRYLHPPRAGVCLHWFGTGSNAKAGLLAVAFY